MSIPYQVVIETASGDALRHGFCNFADDGSFDAVTETVRTDAPRPTRIRGDFDETMMSRWNGMAWVEIAQP